MWETLFVLSVIAGVVTHLRWRKRARALTADAAELRDRLETARTEHREELAREQTRRSVLFNSMLEGVLVLDQDGRVQVINESLRRLFQLRDDITGRTVMEAFRIHELQELVARLFRESSVSGFELDPPGLGRRCLQINAATLRSETGRLTGAILVFRDLSRVKELENTRKEFVANVSHELRTPLSMIKGFVETLLDGAKDDPEVATKFLHTIEKHADRLTYLIEDLLTISRLESGQVIMNLQPNSPREVAARVCEDLAERARARRVTLENEVPAELVASMDGARMQQVFFNLIDNAIKYGPSPGRVTISGRRTDDRVEISIADDGPGIPPEARDRVFERFYRLDKARSRDQGGTGLGLAIVKHIVQAHAGEVWIESGPRNGTAFAFTLQAVDEEGVS